MIFTVGEIQSSTVKNISQEAITNLFQRAESNIHSFVFENHFGNSCLNGKNIVAYSKRVTCVETVAAKGGMNVLSKSEALRIQNAATRINKPINVVGSRATGKAGPYSDWDYVIEGINSRQWSTIKNSLPGARSILDNTPRNIDLFRGPLDLTKPYITIYPY